MPPPLADDPASNLRLLVVELCGDERRGVLPTERPNSLDAGRGAAAWAARFIRRDLRRAAAFLWMMPRLCALSMTLTVCDTDAATSAGWALASAITARVFFT